MRLDEGHTGASMTGCRSRTRPSASRFLFIVIISGTGHAGGGEEGGWNWMEDQVGQVWGVPMTGGSRGSKQQTARSWTYGHEHEQHAQPSPRARRAGYCSSGRTRIASFLHSSFLFSISEVGGTQVPRYCLGTTEARTARGKSRRLQVT